MCFFLKNHSCIFKEAVHVLCHSSTPVASLFLCSRSTHAVGPYFRFYLFAIFAFLTQILVPGWCHMQPQSLKSFNVKSSQPQATTKTFSHKYLDDVVGILLRLVVIHWSKPRHSSLLCHYYWLLCKDPDVFPTPQREVISPVCPQCPSGSPLRWTSSSGAQTTSAGFSWNKGAAAPLWFQTGIIAQYHLHRSTKW